jgi:GNAT superfamily N-acetyltransferase
MALPALAVPETLLTTYLHMTDRSQFRPAFSDDTDGVMIMSINAPAVRFYRFLYSSVGEQWRWRDRLIMPEDELETILSASETSVHVLYVHGVPAGYVELFRQDGGTEIAYFGLCPEFIGRGLGKHLLSYGIARAWEQGTSRVWVHTCNLDGPHALSNYLKRGFTIYDTHIQPMPDRYC